MRLKKIEKPEDIEIVKSFFYDIFFEEKDYDLSHFKASITGEHNFQRLNYYLAYENNTPVGLSGIYASNKNECWLGWFGVRPQYRQIGYATAMLLLQLQMMKDDGYQICRLYTDEVINQTAVKLYIKHGFKKDSDYKEHIITMSKSLDGISFASKWQGIPLGFVSESII